MTLSLAAHKDVLLGLIGPARAPTNVSLAPEDWAAIDAMAAQHRLQPWLHHRLSSGALTAPVPAEVAIGWREAHRAATFGALTAQAALVRLHAALETAEVPMVALKGSRLAFFDYPAAALRPMRDIDVLVAPERLADALDALADAGFPVPADRAAAVARALDGDKHLDPILVPGCDRYVEVHHRIAEPGLPCIDTAKMLAEARTDTLGGAAIAFPSTTHMLGHLVLHAVYNHRFDCGPLALVDIVMLLHSDPVDPVRFADEATAGGWLGGARLVVALVERVMGATGLDIGQDSVPASVVAAGEALLLQDFDQREQVLLASQMARTGAAATLVSRLRKGLAAPSEEGRLHWLSSRAMRTIRQARDPRSREEAGSGATVARWLMAGGAPDRLPD